MAAMEKYKASKNNVGKEKNDNSRKIPNIKEEQTSSPTKNNEENGVGEEVPQKTQDQINAENNANNIKNAAEVAANSSNPYAKAIGTAVKVADKISGGKATQKMGEQMNKMNKIAPGGQQIQNASNKLSESGASDKIGKAAAAKGGNKSGGSTAAKGSSAKSSGGSSSSGGGFKWVAIGVIAMILPLMLFVTVFAEQDVINLGVTNNSEMTSGTGGSGTSVGSGASGVVKGNVMYFDQKDFKNASYGFGETIAVSGCGPTAMAMVLSTLKKSNISPVETADWSLNNGYRVEAGTSWDYFPAIASAYGIKCENVSLSPEGITNALSQGKLIIMSVKPNTTFAPFNSGHFIVLTGITADGKVTVADPYNESNSDKTWDLSTFINDGRSGGLWAFSI